MFAHIFPTTPCLTVLSIHNTESIYTVFHGSERLMNNMVYPVLSVFFNHFLRTCFQMRPTQPYNEEVHQIQRIQRSGREAGHSTATSAEVKKTRLCTSTLPYVFKAPSLLLRSTLV
jgi:hypothetical protein